MVRKKCSYPGCRTYVDYKTRHCEEHNGQIDKDYNRFTRDKESADFYNSMAWRRTRKAVLMEQPLCVRCLEEGVVETAVIVDHVIELKDDWEKRLDITNLHPLCRSCHNTKTAEEKQKRKNY